MASKAGTVVRLIGLWLLVPIALAAIGYYVIGPRLGSHEGDAPSSTTEESVDEGKASKSYSEPKIEVTVKKGSTISARDLTRPRRKKKPPVQKPVDPNPAPPAPTVDPAGGGETVPVGDGNG